MIDWANKAVFLTFTQLWHSLINFMCFPLSPSMAISLPWAFWLTAKVTARLPILVFPFPPQKLVWYGYVNFWIGTTVAFFYKMHLHKFQEKARSGMVAFPKFRTGKMSAICRTWKLSGHLYFRVACAHLAPLKKRDQKWQGVRVFSDISCPVFLCKMSLLWS